MTRRILAIVLAVVMAMSVLAVEAFADTVNMVITATASGTTISVSWNTFSEAKTYDVEVRRSGSVVATKTALTGNNTSVTTNGYGDHVVNVVARNAAGQVVGSGSTTVNVPYSSTYNGITVASSGSDVIVSWTSKSWINTYYVSWSGAKSGNSTVSNSGATCSYTIANTAYSDLSSVSVREGNSSGTLVGTWTPNNNSNWGGNTGGTSQGTGGVYITGTTLYFPATVGTTYVITASGSVSDRMTRVATSTREAVSFDALVSSSTTYITFTVYRSYDNAIVGTATYTRNQNSSTGSVWLDGTTVRWTGVGYQNYYVTVTSPSLGTLVSRETTNGYTYYSLSTLISRYPSATLNVYVYAATDNSLIGTATYYPYGYNPGTGTTTTGTGFNVTATAFSATVSWNSVYNAQGYRVSYTEVGTNNTRTYNATATTVTLSVPASGLYIQVAYLYGGTYHVIGAATVIGGTVSYDANYTQSTQTTTNGVTVTIGENTTTVSWNSYYGATYYQIIYSYYDLTGYQRTQTVLYIYDTKYTLNVGTSNATKSLEVRVIAYDNNGVLGMGPFATVTKEIKTTTSSGNTGTTTKPADTTPEAPTNFKGTATSKKVALSWNKAKNAETYKVYWRRASSSDWKLAKETTKRALTVSGLNNGMSYQFKVVANGHESGILTISPVASGSDVRTAKDPEGSGTSSNKAPVITSATGSTGSFTVAWDGIANGNLYKVYAHRVGVDVTSDGKQTYYVKATVSATSATVNNLAAGTYQIRIKGSTDNGKTWTELKDCDYYTVTVK